LQKVTVHYEIWPEKWKPAHGPLVRDSLRAPCREAARSRKRPTACSPSDHAPRPGRHAARDGNQPTGPLALSASCAPGRNLGLGQESFFPPGLNLGPVIVSRPSQSDECTRFPTEQNPVLRRRTNLASFLSSSAPSHAPQRATPSVRRAAPERASPRRRLEPLAGVRAHCWVNAPPSSGLSGASSRSLAPTRWRASAPSRSHRRRRSRRGVPVRSWARPHVDSLWSGSTRAARRSTTRGSAVDGDCEESE
jgi:hypothetical protein